MISFPDIPGIAIHPTPVAMNASPRFDLEPASQSPAEIQTLIDRKWSQLCQLNPRLHDGPILLAELVNITEQRIAELRATGSPRFAATRAGPALIARPATYKRLATASQFNSEVRALGVQGVVTARDSSGEEHILLGRRSSQVRIYQGLWENAPSGTIAPPAPGASFIDQSHFLHALLAEGIEEVGLNLSAASVSWLALLDDAEARSLDVVFKLQMQQTIDPRAIPCPADDTHRWEYAATAWTPLATLGTWAQQNAHAISPPTRALIRWLIEPAASRTLP